MRKESVGKHRLAQVEYKRVRQGLPTLRVREVEC